MIIRYILKYYSNIRMSQWRRWWWRQPWWRRWCQQQWQEQSIRRWRHNQPSEDCFHSTYLLSIFNNNDSNSKVWHHLCIHFHFFWRHYQNINTNNYWWVNRCTESYCIIIKTNQININSSKSESLDAQRPQSIDSPPPWRTCCALKLWRTALNSCNCCLKPANSGQAKHFLWMSSIYF